MTSQPALPDAQDDDAGTLIRPASFRPPGAGVDLPRPRIPWMLALVGVLLAVIAWTAWFVLSARSVGIETEPAGAAITVESWPAPRIGDHWLLLRGKRRVRVEAPGYTPFDDQLEIGDAQLQTHRVTLLPLPGLLRVGVAPVASAEILIDGVPRGNVPGVVADIAAGEHTVVVRAERFLPFEQRLVIEGKGIEQALDVTLDPAWADVHVDSVPGGSEVRVDGERVGVTPLDIELVAGRRVVELAADGYKGWQQTLRIVPGVAVNLGEIVLAKADGRLRIDSRPAGASVTVDGEYHGVTPLEVAVTPDAAHEVRVLREGYAAASEHFTVGSGKTTELTLELTPELAAIRLETLPENAELLVDGTPRGSATQTLQLPTHEHEITVRAPGYATYSTRVTPRKGVEKRFRIRLKTSDQAGTSGAAAPATTAGNGGARQAAAPASSKGFLTTAAGQRMKLFRGGRATLGSSRRSPGHRANEILREVALERPFYLSLKEVSNAEYRLFLAAHRSGEFAGQTLDGDNQPVAGVSWEQAALYCNWLSRRDGLAPFYQIKYGEVLGINPAATGYRLPTEAEWEWAARFPPGGEPTTYPWGEKFPPQGRSGNYADQRAAAIMGDTLADYDDGFAVAAPIGSYTPNLRGLYDMDGNVAEWVHDHYDAAPGTNLVTDPLGPPAGAQHVIKGASWAQGTRTALRLSFRDYGAEARDDVGFRLARYAQ